MFSVITRIGLTREHFHPKEQFSSLVQGIASFQDEIMERKGYFGFEIDPVRTDIRQTDRITNPNELFFTVVPRNYEKFGFHGCKSKLLQRNPKKKKKAM
jgi:hypothetical protein